jgi:hypothetical protein
MRVLLVGMSNMLASILASALTGDDIELISDLSAGPHDIAAKIRATEADAVIMQKHQASMLDAILPSIKQLPGLMVITISKDGITGTVYEYRLLTVSINDISNDDLRRVLLRNA